VKFGTGERTSGPAVRSPVPNFTFIGATCRPCEKPIFGPLSKTIPLALLAAGLRGNNAIFDFYMPVILQIFFSLLKM